jgi:hypothetical protein
MSADTESLIGGCLCGAIRYRVAGPPEFVAQCFCRDCQKATGTGHTTILGVLESNLFVTGEPKIYSNTGETGGRVSRHFCGNCGGRLFTSGDLPGPMRMLQAGSLDHPERIAPTAALYVKDANPWDMIDPTLPRFERLRPR